MIICAHYTRCGVAYRGYLGGILRPNFPPRLAITFWSLGSFVPARLVCFSRTRKIAPRATDKFSVSEKKWSVELSIPLVSICAKKMQMCLNSNFKYLIER